MSIISKPAMPQAVAAYQAAAKRALAQPAAQGTAALPRFERFLQNELAAATGDLKQSEAQSIDALSGKGNLQQVVEAVTTAELSLQKVTAVRDRVISAYQEIMRMPI